MQKLKTLRLYKPYKTLQEHMDLNPRSDFEFDQLVV